MKTLALHPRELDGIESKGAHIEPIVTRNAVILAEDTITKAAESAAEIMKKTYFSSDKGYGEDMIRRSDAILESHVLASKDTNFSSNKEYGEDMIRRSDAILEKYIRP